MTALRLPDPDAAAYRGLDLPHARLLTELTRQLNDGRVYDRDLPELAAALRRVLDAYNGRPYVRDRNVTGTLRFLR